MEYKLDETGTHIMMDDQGLPIVVTDDDKEFGLDAMDLYTKIPGLQTEAKNGREKVKELKADLKKFKDIKDPADALKAIETVKNLADKELIDAGEVDKLKGQLEKAYRANLEEKTTNYEAALKQKDQQIKQSEEDLFGALVSSQFTKSDYFNGPEPKTNLLPDVGLAYFGQNFKVEEDAQGNKVVVGYYSTGEKVVSQKNPLAVPTFDEAIGAIIEAHPNKERMLSESTGGGARKGRSSGITGPRQVRSDDVNAISGGLEKIAAGELTVVEAA
jgi:hypothetical protein